MTGGGRRPSRPARRPVRRGGRGLGLPIALVAALVVALAGSALWARLAPKPPAVRAADSLASLAKAGRVRVEVLNGSGQAGAAGSVADRLRAAGFEVVTVRNADRFDYPRTLVVARAADFGRARAVHRVIDGSQLLRQRAQSDWDVTVVVGRDQLGKI
jgi:hypothetical protein